MDLPEQLNQNKIIIQAELKKRLPWLIKLRWWVPPGIALGSALALAIGVDFSVGPTLAVGLFILIYNFAFHGWYKRLSARREGPEASFQRFAYGQVGLDLASVFALVFFTGGPGSPFIFFFIFHIIFASMLLNARSAWAFAAFVSVGMGALTAAEASGWIAVRHLMAFRGQTFDPTGNLFHLTVELGFFSASIFITAFLTTTVMAMLRVRIIRLAELSESVLKLLSRLGSLYAMTKSIVSAQDIDKILSVVTSELAQVMGIGGITVKLFTEDRRHLRYAAVHGDFLTLLRDRTVEIDKSPLNRRIIEGESFVSGYITEKEAFQFGADLAVVGVQSVQFVPLVAEDRVIGNLGAYSRRAKMFRPEDVDFFRQAADLVAIALENARAYKAARDLMNERSWFMTRVAHNLRAPIAAMISMLDVVRGNYLGDLNARQQEHLRRIDRRARTGLSMVNELMILAKSRRGMNEAAKRLVDFAAVSERIRRTFQDVASEKGLAFSILAPDGLPPVPGDPELIEQMMENLVSNAIKYTKSGGAVSVAITPEPEGMLSIEVRDNGIGIPDDEKDKLFTEYFRGKNARATEEMGTGLGLPIIKEIAERHGGAINVESREGEGTCFRIRLPVAGTQDAAPSSAKQSSNG